MGRLVAAFSHPAVVVVVSGLVVVGFVLALIFFARSARERAARQAAQQREAMLTRQFEAILGSSRDGVVVTSTSGEVLLVSPTAASILGLDRDAVTGRSVVRLPLLAVDERMRPLLPQEALTQPTEDGMSRTIGVPGRRGSDDVRWLQVTARRVEDLIDGQDAVITTVIDATGMREAAAALGRSDAQFRRAMENAPVGMALVDLEWRLIEVNRALAQMMGSTVSALRGTPLASLSHPLDLQAERDQLQRLYDGHQTHFQVEKRYVRVDGNVVWTVQDVALVRYAGGAPDHYVLQVRDATDDRMRSELLAHRAMHDPLTGLANRTLLQEVLQQVLEQEDALDTVGLLVVDLDGFKGLNDRFGHATGDAALVHVAGVLRAAAAGRGTIARVGGDEFVIVVAQEGCLEVIREISEAIHAGLSKPLQVKRHQLHLRASVGLAVADDEALVGGAPVLLSAADAAMYRAKANGRSRTELFEPTMRAVSGGQRELAAELAEAVSRGDVVLYYQPVVDLATRAVVGYEALARWQHPTRGLLLPAEFLGALEDRPLGVELGAALVEQATAFVASLPTPDVWVSINVSADQLGNSEFASTALQSIARNELSPQRLVVELTEASLVAPNTRIRHELTVLRNAGVPIMLDDFGTGASPLSYLRDLPVSGVKLDMSFVAGIPEDPSGARVSRALGALARELRLATVAEGIETESQAKFLSRCGWRYGQGWLFGVPQPPARILELGADYLEGFIEPRPQDLHDPLDLPPLAFP